MNWIIVLATVAGYTQLWRMGGHGMKWARAFVLPALLALVKFYLVGYWTAPLNWITLAYMPALWGMMAAFSYGVSAPPHKIWVWVFGDGASGNNRTVEMFTRGTCGFCWALAALAFVFVTGNWAGMAGYILFLTFATAFIGGTVEDVEVSERLVGACVALALLV